MEDTLRQLGGLLLKALPTFFLVILLNYYLKAVFFKPLGRVLKQRYDATEGARLMAQKSLDRAAARTAEYEAAMRAARAEVYQAQEQLHRKLQERGAADLAAARKQAEAVIEQAKQDLHQDAEAAKASLARDSEALANEIAESILRRSAA
jgi:F-type H+-transporting ATPase subunit b